MTNTHDSWKIGEVTLNSRFLLGSAGYPSPQTLVHAIKLSGTQILTVGLKRTLQAEGDNGFVALAPASCPGPRRTPAAQHGRLPQRSRSGATRLHGARALRHRLGQAGGHRRRTHLQPEPFELLKAAEELAKLGFTVLPYCTDDLVLCRRLLDAGCPVLMPWGAPIGSGQGLLNPYALRVLRERLPEATLIIDAGIGAPSHAALAMEWALMRCC